MHTLTKHRVKRTDERKLAIKAAKRKATESLARLIFGEKLPITISKKGGEVIVAARSKVTLRAVREIVEAYPHLEMEVTPVRTAIMQYLQPYSRDLEEIESRFGKQA